MSTPASGTQHELRFEDQRAVVTAVGATLRGYWDGPAELVTSFEPDSLPVFCQGQQLIPWPNRVRDGRYTFDGVDHQLPIDEVDRRTAIHGLVRWVEWTTLESTPQSVAQRVRLHPNPGWPGALEASVVHSLGPDGLRVDVSATNIGARALPFGYGAHPFLSAGDVPVDEWELRLPFAAELIADPERLLPIELASPTRPGYAEGRRIGSDTFDTAFARPLRDSDGSWRIRVSGPDAGVELWAGPGLDWAQVFVPPDRASIAVEPMTCGPDALNPGPTHDGLIRLEPGASWSGAWGVGRV